MTIYLNLDGMTAEGADEAIAEFLPKVMKHAGEKDQVRNMFQAIEFEAERLNFDEFTIGILSQICWLIQGMISAGHTGAQALEILRLLHRHFESQFGTNS